MESPLSEGWKRYAAAVRASVNPSGDARLRIEEPERGWRLVDIVGAPRSTSKESLEAWVASRSPATYVFGGLEFLECDCSLARSHVRGAPGCDHYLS